tara:strand:+ start:1467 stop:1703 length:237 start_codon:yes stop_codon:yes gene_type:complete
MSTTYILGVAERANWRQYRDKVFEEISAINEELRIRHGRVLTPKYRNELKLKLTRLRGIAEGIDFVWCQLKEGSHNET